MDTSSDKQAKSHSKNLHMAKRETESLLIAAQNNAIKTNYVKVKIDKTQQNLKCILCAN